MKAKLHGRSINSELINYIEQEVMDKPLSTNDILELARQSRSICKEPISMDEIEKAINSGRP